MSASVVMLTLAATAAAQANAEVDPLSIRVTGDATVFATPDQADIDVAGITRGDTAKRAAIANVQETTRVLVEIERLNGSAGTASTIGYSVHPEYRYPREGREAQISGYLATNVVRVSVSQLEQVGELIDLTIGAGANRVQRVNFTLKDEQPVYAQALREAATRARSEADALAAALGLRIQRVPSAVEEPTAVRPRVDVPRRQPGRGVSDDAVGAGHDRG